MHRTHRPSFVALALVVLLAGGAVACGSSPSEESSTPAGGGTAPAPLPTAPVGTTVVPGTAVGTSVPVSELAAAPSTTTAPVGGGAPPAAPSTTVAPPPVSVAPAPPPTPAPKVLSPELVRWCPVAGEALRILLNAKSLTPADYDNAVQLFTRVRDLAPAEIKPEMEKLIVMANTLLAGIKAGEVTGDVSTDPGPAKAYIDTKMGAGTYDAGVAALRAVYNFGLVSC